MKDPVSLTEQDIATPPGVEVELLFDKPPAIFKERGYTQYFYLQQDSELPIRDVKNTHNEGKKTEPFLERKAENYCSECYPGNINSFTRHKNRRYLFLVTNTRDSILEDEYGRQKWIVGYIEKQRGLRIDGRTSVQGPMKLVSFNDAISVKEINADTGFRSAKELDEDQTRYILKRFADVDNIYGECLKEVLRYENEIGRENPLNPTDLGARPTEVSSSNSEQRDGGC